MATKKTLSILGALAALAFSAHAATSGAATQCDVTLSINPINDFPCGNVAVERLLGRASILQAGVNYSHAVNWISGALLAQAVLLDSNNKRTIGLDGVNCQRSSDQTLNNTYGTTRFCQPRSDSSATKVRFVAD